MIDPGTNDYEQSTIKNYVTKYNELLISKYGLSSSTVSSLISFEELLELGCSKKSQNGPYTCTTTNFPWLYSTSYWTKSTTSDSDIACAVRNNQMTNEFGYLGGADADFNYYKYIDQVFSVRPLVTISIDDL